MCLSIARGVVFEVKGPVENFQRVGIVGLVLLVNTQ